MVQIAEIVAKLSGIPVAQLTAEERERLLDMEARLHERVIGEVSRIAHGQNVELQFDDTIVDHLAK